MSGRPLYFNAPHAASVFGKNEEVASLGDPAPSDPVMSLTHGRVIVSRENFRVVSRGLLAGSGITDDRRYIALQCSPRHGSPSPCAFVSKQNMVGRNGQLRIWVDRKLATASWNSAAQARSYSDVTAEAGEVSSLNSLAVEPRRGTIATLQAFDNLEARALPLKRMLADNRSFDPKAVALLLEAFDEVVADLDLRTDADREKAAKIVMRLALGQAELDGAKIRAEVIRLMRREGRGRRRAF